MPHLARALDTFGRFLALASIDGGLIFWFPASFMLLLLAASFASVPPPARRHLRVLAALPACWIFIGLWGGYFRFDWHYPFTRYPAWVFWPIEYGLWFFALLGLALIWRLPAGRVFGCLFAAFNFYFMWWMTIFAGLAVSGLWL